MLPVRPGHQAIKRLELPIQVIRMSGRQGHRAAVLRELERGWDQAVRDHLPEIAQIPSIQLLDLLEATRRELLAAIRQAALPVPPAAMSISFSRDRPAVQAE